MPQGVYPSTDKEFLKDLARNLFWSGTSDAQLVLEHVRKTMNTEVTEEDLCLAITEWLKEGKLVLEIKDGLWAIARNLENP